MIWHDVREPSDSELDRLAERYHLHPLHIEDCRHGRQRSKVEDGNGYLFAVVKLAEINDGEIEFRELDLFLGSDFLISVMEDPCPAAVTLLDGLKARGTLERADQLFYRILDGVVDGYLPVLDAYSDHIDELEDEVLEHPAPQTLEHIFSMKRGLIELRRVLTNMRDVAGHLQRSENPFIARDLWPFLRDIYDHVARNLDIVEMQRDLLSGSMDIYLSSVANRTNQTMKVLTVLGTVALPAIVISGFYGMNTKDLPWADHAGGAWIAVAMMAVSTSALLWFLKRHDWW